MGRSACITWRLDWSHGRWGWESPSPYSYPICYSQSALAGRKMAWQLLKAPRLQTDRESPCLPMPMRTVSPKFLLFLPAFLDKSSDQSWSATLASVFTVAPCSIWFSHTADEERIGSKRLACRLQVRELPQLLEADRSLPGDKVREGCGLSTRNP